MRPFPTSGNTERGGTAQYDVAVTVRVRARNGVAARERLERWVDELLFNDSVEEVLVAPARRVDPEAGNLCGEPT